MKKPSKRSNNSGSKAASRHAKTTKKPVTIDLKAETSKTVKSTVPNAVKPDISKESARSSVPKTATADSKASSKPDLTKKNTSAPDIKKTNTNDKPTTKDAVKKATSMGQQDNVKKPAPATKKQSSGLGSKLAAAVVGGVIALSGAGLLQYLGFLGYPGAGSNAPAGTYASAEDLKSTRDKFEADLKQLSDKQAAGLENSGVDEAAVSKIVDEKIAASAPSSELQATLSKLQEGVQKNADILASAEGAETGDTLTTALASIAALKAQISKLEASSENNAEITTRIESVEQQTSELASLKQGLTELQTAVETQKGSLTELATTVETGPDKKAAMAIAAAALKADIDRGLPFAGSLQTLQGVAGADTDFSLLTKFAEQGVPNSVAIANDFQGSVSDAILVALAPPSDNSLTSRLLAGAKSLVKVKQLSPVTGDTPDAVLSRIGAALLESKLQTASDEWQKLPEAGQEVSKAWHEKLQSRIAVDSLIDSTVRSFLISNAG